MVGDLEGGDALARALAAHFLKKHALLSMRLEAGSEDAAAPAGDLAFARLVDD